MSRRERMSVTLFVQEITALEAGTCCCSLWFVIFSVGRRKNRGWLAKGIDSDKDY